MISKRDQAWFEKWGYSLAEMEEASKAYFEFLVVEMQGAKESLFASPFGRRAFMIGWLMKMSEGK